MSKLKLSILTGVMALSVSLPAVAQTPAAAAQTPDAAQAPMRVSAAEQDKKISKRVNPKYPKEAFDAKLTAVINLETIIDADGKVQSVRPLTTKADEMLIKAATDAVKQWEYKPTKVKGVAVPVMTIVTINFKVGE